MNIIFLDICLSCVVLLSSHPPPPHTHRHTLMYIGINKHILISFSTVSRLMFYITFGYIYISLYTCYYLCNLHLCFSKTWNISILIRSSSTLKSVSWYINFFAIFLFSNVKLGRIVISTSVIVKQRRSATTLSDSILAKIPTNRS